MVRYGTSVAYDFEVSSPALVTSHTLALTGLSPDTIYHYQVVSADAAHNVSASNDFLFSVPPPDVVWPGQNWATATPEEMGMDGNILTGARDYALTTGQGGGSGMIVRRGRVVLSWGSMSTRYDLRSTTKSIGSTALGLLLKDRLGQIRITDRAIDFHPSLGIPPQSNADTGWLENITLLNLGTHTAGFGKDGGYTALLFAPGTAWSYSDGGANWLAEALTLSYQEDLNILLFDRVFTPIGIGALDLTWRSNLHRSTTIDGIPNREFGSGISADVKAMARLGYLFLRKGNWNGQQILTPDFIDLVRQPHPLVVGLPVYQPQVIQDTNSPRHYGVLWWNNADGRMPEVPTDTFMSSGANESFIIVIPSLDIVVVRAGNTWRTDTTTTSSFYDLLGPFLNYVVESVQN
jgi:CubicO group peptidase (beta-lactamase class C family)